MRLVFAGTPQFAALALARLHEAGHHIPLVVTQPDRRAGRGMRATPSAVKQTALERGLPLFQPDTLRDDLALTRIVEAQPEMLVVAAYGKLLPVPILEAAPHGAVNIHASLLPRWRGAAPIQRAILAGDAQTGISIMQMDSGLDTGPVLARHALPIAPDDDAGSLHDKLAALGAHAIVAALAAVQSEGAKATRQAAEGVTYAQKVTKEETHLDWKRSAEELERAVRAFRPAPGASADLAGERVKIWMVRLADGSGPPGTVLERGERVVIACARGALELSEIQPAGGRRMTAAAFMRGRTADRGDPVS